MSVGCTGVDWVRVVRILKRSRLPTGLSSTRRPAGSCSPAHQMVPGIIILLYSYQHCQHYKHPNKTLNRMVNKGVRQLKIRSFHFSNTLRKSQRNPNYLTTGSSQHQVQKLKLQTFPQITISQNDEKRTCTNTFSSSSSQQSVLDSGLDTIVKQKFLVLFFPLMILHDQQGVNTMEI